MKNQKKLNLSKIKITLRLEIDKEAGEQDLPYILTIKKSREFLKLLQVLRSDEKGNRLYRVSSSIVLRKGREDHQFKRPLYKPLTFTRLDISNEYANLWLAPINKLYTNYYMYSRLVDNVKMTIKGLILAYHDLYKMPEMLEITVQANEK